VFSNIVHMAAINRLPQLGSYWFCAITWAASRSRFGQPSPIRSLIANRSFQSFDYPQKALSTEASNLENTRVM
jgi:hypothetical protein